MLAEDVFEALTCDQVHLSQPFYWIWPGPGAVAAGGSRARGRGGQSRPLLTPVLVFLLLSPHAHVHFQWFAEWMKPSSAGTSLISLEANLIKARSLISEVEVTCWFSSF